jgi:hypothetical protein
MHAADFGQEFELLIQRPVRVRLAREGEMAVVSRDKLAEGLVAIEIIAQQRQRARRKTLRMALEPTLGGPQFAILLFAAILWADKLGLQRNHSVLARRNDQGSDQTVRVVGATADHVRAALPTVNLLRAKVLRAIQGA